MIEQINKWFELAVPDTDARRLDVQIGVHFEEVVEMLETLQGASPMTNLAIQTSINTLSQLANALKSGTGSVTITNREWFLDALCDQVVTATGCGHMANMDVVTAIKRVNDSNFSKFSADGTPIFDANGKIAKGPSYHKPDLGGLY